MASGVDFQKKDLFKDCKGECEIKERDVELRRLIVPIVARFLLLVLEISVIALSGEILVSEGNGTIRSPLLVPIEGTAPLMADGTPTAIEGCRNELASERSTASMGTLETCTTIVRSEGPGTPAFDEVDITVQRRYDTNEIQFSFFGTGGSKFRSLSLTSTYQSHDQFIHTLLPFEKLPDGFTGVGFDLQGLVLRDEAIFQIDTLNQIYERLAFALGVSEEDQIQNFTLIPPIGNDVRRIEAKFRNNDAYDFDQDVMVDALNSIILNQFKLEFTDQDLVAFDPRSGQYGPERGDGRFVFQQNMVPWWVWLLLTVVLGAFVFDRINVEDPDFHLFRAFALVTGNDGIAGPLALPESEFEFGKFQSGKVGHMGFGPPREEHSLFTRVDTFENVEDVK